MQRRDLYNTLLRLDYEDLVRSCQVNPETQRICEDPLFWEAKSQQDFKTSIRQVESERLLSPREKYLAILSQKDVTWGSEEFIEPEVCLSRAACKGRTDLTDYFLQSGEVPVDAAIIASARDKGLFDQTVARYGVDVYANPNLLYAVILEGIKTNNFPLLRDLVPDGAALIVEDWQSEEILNQAAATGNYELIDYLHDYFYIRDSPDFGVDEWYLQAALLKGDEAFSEELITDMLNNRQYQELAAAFVRAGEYQRLDNLIHLPEFQGYEGIGLEILLDATQYHRISMVKLVAEDPVFQLARRRSWFEQALVIAEVENNLEIQTYLTNLLQRI